MWLNIFPLFKTAILAMLLFSPVFSAGGHCGTMQFIENIKNPQKKMLAKAGCNPESLYGTVHSRTTQNFIIYYTTEGSHRIKTLAYIDSLALYLEQAYKLHKDSLGMKGIQGISGRNQPTYQYRQTVPAGLYPVEIIDTGLLRDEEGDYAMTFGLTFALYRSSPKSTQIIIENDFLYGADCSGKESTRPFTQGNVNYSVSWDLALKVTAFHELYHSFQMTQLDITKYDSFWLEASATGAEEIGAPDINDYINYLSNASRYPGESMENSDGGYEYASLYLFLFSELGPKFDSHIWNYFSKYPQEKFAVQLARLADSLGINAEEMFHKYAQGIFFSGNRALVAQASLFWPEDQHLWPVWSINQSAPNVLPATAINFVRNRNGQQLSTDSANISLLNYGDSTVWVLSRLLEKEYAPPASDPSKSTPLTCDNGFTVCKNPWNPNAENPLKFGPLPPNSKGVEIRSAKGDLIKRIEGKQGDELTWQPENPPKAGILYYRSFPYGKGQVLIVVY